MAQDQISSTVADLNGEATRRERQNDTEVYAIHGADPEVLAYAMAKYSRSSLSMRESLAEIDSQRAEQFLNTFYFQYGHRSIADLAHIPFAIERLSLLAAITLVDEQRWDGQERSTRYQDFRKSGWYTPTFGDATAAYTSVIEASFEAYDKISLGVLEALKTAITRPEAMKPDAYERTLKARAFDVARYLLPLATNTSLGQIVNARTLETQVSRLLTSEFAEIRDIAEKLRAAASEPAWNVQHAISQALVEEIRASDPALADRLAEHVLRPVKTAPTLVKYANPSDYITNSRAELRAAAEELMAGKAIEAAPVVDLVDDGEALEIEIATSLLYPHCHYSYRQLRREVEALSASRRDELVALGAKRRGRYDELSRSFSAGQGLRFDILMDIGGFRDMHRHRRCTQLLQDFTDLHGYETPECPGQPDLAEVGLAEIYNEAMDAALRSYRRLKTSSEPEAAQSAQYALPLGVRCRSMFKMDFAEALYISELRSGVAGHFSYRRVAWEMYRAVARRHPSLAAYFRIEDVNQPIDLLRR